MGSVHRRVVGWREARAVGTSACLLAGLGGLLPGWAQTDAGGAAATAPVGVSAPGAGGISTTPPLQALRPVPTSTSGFVSNQVLVRFRSGVAPDRQRAVLAASEAHARFLRPPGRKHARLMALPTPPSSMSAFDHLAVVQLDGLTSVGTAIAYFQRQPEVLYAEPNYRLHITAPDQAPARVIPDDFDFPSQWALLNSGQGGGKAGADIDASEAWALGTGDRRVKVAVIDTGIDYNHPDLAANLWWNPGEVAGNGLDDDGNGYIDDVYGYDFVNDDNDPMDDHGHGTHVAGIIGAVGNNRIGIAGVCWSVSLMALKAFDDQGNGNLEDVVAAIQYASQNGAQVINASWSSQDRSRSLKEAVTEAHQAGLVLVGAAGNNRNNAVEYPAAYPEVVAVAATDLQDQRAQFSNYGTNVALAAPGDRIYSTLPDASYDSLSGTSMAAPQVTGVAALILANHPAFSNLEVETILRNAVDPIVPDQYIGTGRLNAAKAMRVQVPLPQAHLILPTTLSGQIDVAGTAAGDHFASYTLDYGADLYPQTWTQLYTATNPVTNGVLLSGFSTATLQETNYTIRLTVRDTFGQTASDRVTTQVRNVLVSAPQPNDVLRAGEPIAIQGTVFGPSRSYTLEYGLGWQPAEWFTNGITVANGGTQQVVAGLLGTWDTSTVAPNTFYTLRLTALAPGRAPDRSLVPLLYLDGHLRAGWPLHMPIAGDSATNDWRELVVADLDRNGHQQLIRVDPGNADGQPARLLVFEADGRLRWSRDLASGVPYCDTPVVGDIDGDGFPEIFVDVGDQGQLFAFHHDGTPLGGNWPVHLEATALGKVLADLNGDGNVELIGYAQNPVTINHRAYRQLIVIDRNGVILRKWPLQDFDPDLDIPKMFPAVGKFHGISGLGIVAVSAASEIALFSFQQPDVPVWRARVAGDLLSSPVVGDLNQDGKNEIVIGSYDPRASQGAGTQGGVYAFDDQGIPLPGWPVLIDESFAATPALADFYGDGHLEIAIPSWSSQQLHLIQSSGFEGPGWPVGPIDRTVLRSSPVIGDVNGDGAPEIVMACPGQFLLAALDGDLSCVGGVRAWNALGQQVNFGDDAGLTSLVIESAGGSLYLKAAPVTLASLEPGGKMDIIATTIDDRAFARVAPLVTRKNRYSIYVWELNVPAIATNLVWPMFQRNPQHTGYLEPPKIIDQPPVVEAIPDQTVRSGTPFFPIALDGYVDDPDDPPNRLTWVITGNQSLSVVINSNRVATVSAPSPTWTGQETLTFTARDPSGLSQSTTAVFAVRANYNPPVANPDQASTIEEIPIEIDVLANDTDPLGFPLRVLSFSRPQSGKVSLTAKGTLRYTPRQDFNGSDSFSYTIIDDHGGMAIGTVTILVAPDEDPPAPQPDLAITLEGAPVEIQPLANDQDPDGDPLTITAFSQATNGVVTLVAGTNFVYTPNTNFHGLDGFNYSITDGHGYTNTTSVTVMVKPINSPPVASDLTLTLNRNTSVDVIFRASDPDGDPLTFTVVKGPEHGSLWNYPQLATYYPNKGFAGTDSFTYQANDGQYDSDVATVSLTVIAANNPPKAQDLTLTVRSGRPRPVNLDVSDADNQPLTIAILEPPQHGTLDGSGTNYTYTPTPGFLGDDAFVFDANDGETNSAPATVTLKITNVNTAPVAADSVVHVLQNTSTNIVPVAYDNEGDPLTFTILTPPLYGKLTGIVPNLIYTPPTNYSGPDRFTFKVNDGDLDSGPGTVTLEVAPPNQLPVAQDQNLTVAPEVSTAIPLRISDPDAESLRCAILKGPKNGLLYGFGTNFTYKPKPGFTGSDSFTYKVWDGFGYSPVAHVNLLVQEPMTNSVPSFDSVAWVDGSTLRLTLNAQPGSTVQIQSSTNLLNWTILSTLIPSSGAVTFVDTNTAAFPLRFYRALQR